VAEDEDAPWYRPLLVGVGALVGVAVLVGGLIGVIAVGAVNVTGLDDSQSPTRAEPSLYLPDRADAADDEDEDDPGLTLDDLNPGRSSSAPPSPRSKPTGRSSVEAKDGKKKEPKRKPPRSVISLSASPVTVSPMERIYISGTYPRGEGKSLQVQRREGGWRDFPTSASVSGGTFSSYVMTGQSGVNKFRVVDRSNGKTSNVVTVRVR
jgi:hypothetical protein